MNDFTKEELIDFAEIVCEWGSYELYTKLESMIDNYCEHDNECEHDWGVGFGSIHSPVTYCKKCYCQKTALPSDVFKTVMGVNK